MSNLELLNRAANATSCSILQNIGAGLISASVFPLWTPKGQLVALGAGAAATMAANYLCSEFDIGSDNPADLVDGCQVVTGTGTLQFNTGDGIWRSRLENGAIYSNVKAITATTIVPKDLGYITRVGFIDGNGVSATYETQQVRTFEQEEGTKWRVLPNEGSTCEKDGGGPQPLPPGYDTPVQYTDEITNCNYTVSLQGFAQVSEDGEPAPVFKIEGVQQLRADGGRAGGCNFPPVIYMPPGGGGNGGGGGTYLPYPDGPEPGPGPEGLPWWVGPLATAVGAALLDDIIDGVVAALEPDMNAGSFTLTAPCNKDDEGNPLTKTWSFPAEPYNERLLSHQIALMEIMQQHLDWKTPICDEQTIPEGDFRTISFRSDETSPYGKSRLRKRFRYRSVSGNDLSAIVDHWKDFAWEGGPYRVRWIGSTWRSPEIWAASESEGQRVIQHAAAEAGFGPLEGGRWSTRLSSSGRQGVPGTMRVDTTKGFYWITARDGSDQRPIVALT